MEDLHSPLKSELFTLDISFSLLDVKELFTKYVNSKYSITIRSVEATGCFQGEFLIK